MTDVDDLPDGWAVATIEDLCTLNPKHPATVGDTTEVSFVPMAAVSDLDGRIVGTETRKYGEVKKGYTHFADGDVIFAKITPCMENGKAASVRGLANGLACGTTEFFVFRSRGAVDQDYLFHFIRQECFRKAARATMQSGVGQARVPKEFVMNTELPLPPLAEQRRIVAKVEELTARSRAARAALAEVPTLLEQFRQSVLASAFRGNLTADWRAKNPNAEPASVLLDRIRADRRKQWETKYPKKKYAEPEPVDDSELPELPEGWCWASVDELAEVQLGQRRAPEYIGKAEYAYIRSANITWEGLDLTDVKRMGFDDAEPLLLRRGDILLNEASGSPTEVGKPALWNDEIPACCLQATVLRLRGNSTEVSPLWLFYHSLRDALLAEYAAKCPGLGIIHLTAKLLRKWPVALAPLAEQTEIIRRLDLAERQRRSTASAVSVALQDNDALDQSILAKAFRGELVPQDPADEPASVLLERLRASQAEGSANGTAIRTRRKASP